MWVSEKYRLCFVAEEEILMNREEYLNALQAALRSFIDVVERIPTELFLRRYGECSPRDVVAHLIGWNYATREGSERLRHGFLPVYYEHGDPDFRIVNAQSFQTYASTDKQILLDELQDSLSALRVYLASIPLQEWNADSGVRYQGRIITIAGTISAMIEEYTNHGRELARWTGLASN
jgi:hypothetical protein